MIKRLLIGFILFTFISVSILPPNLGFSQDLALPIPGVMIHPTSSFEPAMIDGIKIDSKNPFLFDVLIDPGQIAMTSDQKKETYSHLIKYFLTSLTTPEQDMWVNLSPYETHRIIAPNFGQTLMGRDMLGEDYILKQLTSSLMYPEKDLGKNFWSKIYTRLRAQYGSINIPFNTFNKVWIIPSRATVYENGNIALIVDAHLKVLLDQDYWAMNKHTHLSSSRKTVQLNKDIADIIRQNIVPAIEKEVNEGEDFVLLRQMYYSLILSTWFKKRLTEHLLHKIYVNQNKINGVKLDDVKENQRIYQRYLSAYKKGVYNYIKEEPDPLSGQIMPRKYFSGGITFDATNLAGSAILKTTSQMTKRIIGRFLRKPFDTVEFRLFPVIAALSLALSSSTALAGYEHKGDILVQGSGKHTSQNTDSLSLKANPTTNNFIEGKTYVINTLTNIPPLNSTISIGKVVIGKLTHIRKLKSADPIAILKITPEIGTSEYIPVGPNQIAITYIAGPKELRKNIEQPPKSPINSPAKFLIPNQYQSKLQPRTEQPPTQLIKKIESPVEPFYQLGTGPNSVFLQSGEKISNGYTVTINNGKPNFVNNKGVAYPQIEIPNRLYYNALEFQNPNNLHRLAQILRTVPKLRIRYKGIDYKEFKDIRATREAITFVQNSWVTTLPYKDWDKIQIYGRQFPIRTLRSIIEAPQFLVKPPFVFKPKEVTPPPIEIHTFFRTKPESNEKTITPLLEKGGSVLYHEKLYRIYDITRYTIPSNGVHGVILLKRDNEEMVTVLLGANDELLPPPADTKSAQATQNDATKLEPQSKPQTVFPNGKSDLPANLSPNPDFSKPDKNLNKGNPPLTYNSIPNGGIDFDPQYLQMNLKSNGSTGSIPKGFEWLLKSPLTGFNTKILWIESGVGFELSFFKGILNPRQRQHLGLKTNIQI